jgi:hypothetical protein
LDVYLDSEKWDNHPENHSGGTGMGFRLRICTFIVASLVLSRFSALPQEHKGNATEPLPQGIVLHVALRTDLSTKYSRVGDPVGGLSRTPLRLRSGEGSIRPFHLLEAVEPSHNPLTRYGGATLGCFKVGVARDDSTPWLALLVTFRTLL